MMALWKLFAVIILIFDLLKGTELIAFRRIIDCEAQLDNFERALEISVWIKNLNKVCTMDLEHFLVLLCYGILLDYTRKEDLTKYCFNTGSHCRTM